MCIATKTKHFLRRGSIIPVIISLVYALYALWTRVGNKAIASNDVAQLKLDMVQNNIDHKTIGKSIDDIEKTMSSVETKVDEQGKTLDKILNIMLSK